MNPRIHPKKFYTGDLRQHQRRAAISVLETYADIQSVFGVAQAIDYSRNTGGQGAQFSSKKDAVSLLDFVIDVAITARKELDKNEMAIFNKLVATNDFTVQTEEMMEMLEKLGRLFQGRGIYPTREYFRTIKR